MNPSYSPWFTVWTILHVLHLHWDPHIVIAVKTSIPYYYFWDFFSIYVLNIELLIWLSFGLISWFKSYRIVTIHRVCDFNIRVSFLRIICSVLYMIEQLIWIPYFLSCGPRRKTHHAGFGQVRRAPPSPAVNSSPTCPRRGTLID